jgi:hypothetical protein
MLLRPPIMTIRCTNWTPDAQRECEEDGTIESLVTDEDELIMGDENQRTVGNLELSMPEIVGKHNTRMINRM